jgi:hypothetical protein
MEGRDGGKDEVENRKTNDLFAFRNLFSENHFFLLFIFSKYKKN